MVGYFSGGELAGERSFEGALEETLQRARAIDGGVAFAGDVFLGSVGQVEGDVAVGQAGAQERELEVHSVFLMSASVHGIDELLHQRGIRPVLLVADGAEVVLPVAVEPPHALVIPKPGCVEDGDHLFFAVGVHQFKAELLPLHVVRCGLPLRFIPTAATES